MGILCFCVLSLSPALALAQGEVKSPPAPANAGQQSPAQESAPAPAAAAKPAPPGEEYETSDGKFSIQLFYWLNPANPHMRIGRGAPTTSNSQFLDYPGKSKPTPGLELSLPAGGTNTLRMEYFVTKGHGDTTATEDVTYYVTDFAPGDFLSTRYTMQHAKIWLDFISWPFPLKNARFRFKTLWGVQYTSIRTSVDAPLKPPADAAGNAVNTYSIGTNWFLYPSLGVGIEYMLSKHLRFEMSGSGFAFPHRSTIWDADGKLAYKSGSFEIVAGGKGFHFKTSPKREQYVFATMGGAFVGVRWYPKF